MSESSPGQSFLSSQTTNTSLAAFSSITTPFLCHLSPFPLWILCDNSNRLKAVVWIPDTAMILCVHFFFPPHIHRVRKLCSSVKLDPCRSKTWFFKGQTILSTVSWLSCWKELRCLNLDFSHGLTQANVLSMQHARQQAPQLSPAVKCPQSPLTAPVTGNQADMAPPTSTSPAHPSSQVESAPLARYPSWDETSEAASSRSSTKPKRLSPARVPPPPAQGIGSPFSYQHAPSQFPPPPLPSLTQHLTAKERRAF